MSLVSFSVISSLNQSGYYIVTYLLKAVELEKKPLLANDSEKKIVLGNGHGAAIVTHTRENLYPLLSYPRFMERSPNIYFWFLFYSQTKYRSLFLNSLNEILLMKEVQLVSWNTGTKFLNKF